MTVHYYTIIMFTVLVLLVYTCVIYVPQSINQLPLPFFSINQSSPYNPIFMIYVHYIILDFNPFILEPCRPNVEHNHKNPPVLLKVVFIETFLRTQISL